MAESEDINHKITLKDIKSSYNINHIFSFLSQKDKLNLIVYNKEIQKMLSVGIEDYKNSGSKYKIGGKNGKVRLFSIDGKDYHLIFEGKYLNGKKNGKGFEYDGYSKNLIFEGKYLNGKRRKGKEYYINGKLKYEGEYLDGKIWNGKGYNVNGKLEYEIKNGAGNVKELRKKEYNDEQSVLEFEGEYLNGIRNGKGKEYDKYGDLIYEGEYLDGIRLNGKEYENRRIKFEGQYLNGKIWNGKKYEYVNGRLKFKGDYLNGKKNGKAKEYEDNILIFEG